MALWDGLIPDAEQEVYHRAGYGRLRGFGTRGALLVVDMEYNFTGEQPEPVWQAIEKFKDSCGVYAWTALPFIRRLLDLSREARLPVFFTHGVPKGGRAGEADRGTAIVDEVKPAPGEVVIAKDVPSAFFGTHLASYLIERRIDTVIVTGCTTSGCVRATVLDSYSYRFKTVVPIEAVFDRAETPHRVNLFDMAMKYAHVVPSREVEDWITAQMARGADG
ncbi:MAG TPA: isochorismatase family protein [Methylomirabilota bacterium]|jgi:nicotinamidase-related amidase|nr:isochorismatase family protein [Methylomirabilota bacterium]